MKDELKAYGLKVYESESPDRQLVDFDVSDRHDNIAWVWGDNPDDVDWECTHDSNHGLVEFGDDDDYGQCKLCGSFCTWHWEEDVLDNYPDEMKKIQERCIDEWQPRQKVGGMIGDYLKELKERS